MFSTTLNGTYTATLSNVEKGTVVYVKAAENTAGDGSILAGGLSFKDDDTMQAIVTDAPTGTAVAGQAGVYQFTMPNVNVLVDGATVTRCKVLDGSIKSDLTEINLKIGAGDTAPSGDALLELAKNYINANAAKLGVDSATIKSVSTSGAVTSKLYITKNGLEDVTGIADTEINTDDTAVSVEVETLNGMYHVVSVGTDYDKLGTILQWAGLKNDATDVTVVSAGVNPLVIIEKGSNKTTEELDATDTSTTVADGSTIKTNPVSGKYAGYIAVDGALVTTALTGGSVLTGGGTISIALSEKTGKLITINAAAMKYAMKANEVPAAGGTALDMKVTVSHDKEETVKTEAGKAINAAITCDGVASDGWTTKAAIAGLESGATWAAATKFDNEFKLTNHGTAVNTITVTLTLTFE